MKDKDLAEAFKNVRKVMEGRSQDNREINNPFIANAVNKISKSNLPKLFQKRHDEIQNSKENVNSNTISVLLESCAKETVEAREQYRNGQLRSLFLHLNNDIKMCSALNLSSQKLRKAKTKREMAEEIKRDRKETSWVSGYLNLGVIDSEDAIAVHLDLTDWLSKKILNPKHTEQHLMTAIDFAKASAGFLPNFGLLDYAIALKKANPKIRIKSDLETGDKSISYWENYLDNIQEWIRASSAFQLRIEDALLSMKIIKTSE